MSSRYKELLNNMKYVYCEEGVVEVARRLAQHAGSSIRRLSPKLGHDYDGMSDFVDVLFINGCDYSVPHPIRYRVDHQAEQLEAVGISTKIINAWEIDEDYARIARVFVIFRCPYADVIGDFINLAHALNKKVYFDIDDLVIDTVYTDSIPFVASMAGEARAQYDDGVRRMGKTLSLCDGVITTTDQLAAELSKYSPEVFINRNVASEEMLYFSERAVYERDQLPYMNRDEVKPKDRHRWKLSKERLSKRSGFSLGYFSGSITHNDDFEMILPVLVDFMGKHNDVKLHVVGELDLPEQLKPFEDRIVKLPFAPWRHLPKMISGVDVNLIPLRDTIFNRAKSENKWVEAALVKVPSIASNVGALADSIRNDVDGVLCDNTESWSRELENLYLDAKRRKRIAECAFETCKYEHLTTSTGMKLAEFMRSSETENIAFVFPGMTISGGVLVGIKHAEILQSNGIDVTLIAPEFPDDKEGKIGRWVTTTSGKRLPVLYCKDAAMQGKFDKMVATMWPTVDFVNNYFNSDQSYYLVQGYETDFYQADAPDRFKCSATYGWHPKLTYCTISKWCVDWLNHIYDKRDVRFARNGIDLDLFSETNRDFGGKVRILIEGDSSSEYKNVDESFRIVNLLPPEKYEIWYLSYKGEPKGWYRVDKFLRAVPHESVGDIYGQCHILLKTSILDSFSYPPLEMMATGGFAVVLRNGGNAEFLEDGVNSLLFNKGEDEKAAALIERLSSDGELRDKLRANGLKTAQSRSWDTIQDEILELYK